MATSLRSSPTYKRAIVTVLLLCFLGLRTSMSQGFVRSVHGTVTDGHGRPLSGAIVQVENPTTLQIRSYRTGSDGHYHFRRLNTKISYRIHAQYRGHRGSSETLSRFDTRKDAVLDLTVELGS